MILQYRALSISKAALHSLELDIHRHSVFRLSEVPPSFRYYAASPISSKSRYLRYKEANNSITTPCRALYRKGDIGRAIGVAEVKG